MAVFVVKVAGELGMFRQDGFLALCAALLRSERRHRRLRLMVTNSRKTINGEVFTPRPFDWLERLDQ